MLSKLAMLALAICGFASADPIAIYDLSGTLNDGGDLLSILGTFDYDTSNNAVSNWDLAISGSGPFCSGTPCFMFLPGISDQFGETGTGTASFTPDEFQFVYAQAGGTDTLNLFPGNSSSPLPDGTYTLDSSSGLFTVNEPSGATGEALFTTGTLSDEPSGIPEPDKLPIVIAGALLCIVAKKRRQSSQAR
jgi:hypothetical protein